ncbi:hypothetical protein A2392_01940 [Candidatus Kaiserbacteria bacterium RIFOXYB1_FULL_46_14]|uniref:Solute-binding protein family 5 domain-containing protein n=1 Tax=Candidatus Kaiserbacteria bacterium RIFOXYB1_FULL_46_14 TaxID=1798531 RepID=A0A1F6FK05_9BACT|nr:MAG: hypothetical protein A2392_01940 [Candidatus Kaiserbacteria bacterium RIFOXYB1_FULL_46_14]
MDRWFSYLDQLRPFDRLVFGVLFLVFVFSLIVNSIILNQSFLVSVPEGGGKLIEGAIGSPRFINPVLAITRADHDLVALTYSGILRLSPSGEFENDLAESVTISDDGRVYNVILRQDRKWHDGTPVTAEDIAYTIALIQNPDLKSPLRGNWSGVTVELIGRYEINFVLENPYAPFVENMTVGILPKHIWETLSDEELPFSQHNIEPIGSGPYEVAEIKRNPAGLVSEYHLRVSPHYNEQTNLNQITIRFYQNEEAILNALKEGKINATGALSERWLNDISRDDFNFISEPLPRVFSVFYNQNKNPALRDKAVREALSVVVDRDELLKLAVNGYGRAAYSPLPPGFTDVPETTSNYGTKEERLKAARQILEAGGWAIGANGRYEKKIDGIDSPLTITMRSGNSLLFETISSYLTGIWQEMGADVSVELYEQSDLVQTIIRPRDYQILIFGADIGRSLDLYPFWHSSQREDPGLNVSLYANIAVDQLVSELRTATSSELRTDLLRQFSNEIANEQPATFLFAPSFEYVIDSHISTAEMKRIQRPSERFSNVTDWYMNESGVWSFFADRNWDIWN